jgi:DNA-binding response OmpR family regulator
MARLLDRAGWTTDLAFSASSGLHQLEGTGTTYDAVVVDLATSTQDIELLLALRSDRSTSSLRVVICTRADEPDLAAAAVAAWNAGADGLLTHPFGAEAFTEELISVTARAESGREAHRRNRVEQIHRA